MKKSILLIGGAGFLGSRLAAKFSGDGWDVGILDRIAPAEEGLKAEFFTGELRDMHLLRRALEKFSRVVYLAHETRTAPAADRLPANFLGNIELLLLVLEEIQESQAEDFVLLSSGGAVYGEPEFLPISEDHPTRPRSPYGIAKLTMERYLSMVAEQKGFRHLEIRPSNPYGPGQNFQAAQGIVAVAMARIARGDPLTIRGDGSATKDYLFISDFAEACIKLVSNPAAAGPFNIGSGRGTPLNEVISRIEKAVGRKANLIFEPAQPGDVTANVLDISRVCGAVDWSPRTMLDEGIAQTWSWMKPKLFRRSED